MNLQQFATCLGHLDPFGPSKFETKHMINLLCGYLAHGWKFFGQGNRAGLYGPEVKNARYVAVPWTSYDELSWFGRTIRPR